MSDRRPLVLGLTGSIGMGKSTTAAIFAESGIPVWDADAAVHRLYARGAAGTAAIARLVPEAIVDGAVDRARLKEWLARTANGLSRLEAAIHPLVAADRKAFLETAARAGHRLVVLDIPLLFETGGESALDAVVVVSVDAAEQRRRVLARPGMTEEHFDTILRRQMPDAEKRRRADFVIETDTPENARARVAEIVATLTERHMRKGETDAGDCSRYRNNRT